MRPSSRVLVVSRNSQQRETLQRWLVTASYEVELAADFNAARARLDASRPELMVADIKLGAYNGLHLAIWSRGRNLATRTILIGDADGVLVKEAERERAVYMTPPLTEQVFLSAVASLLGSYTPARRSPRKRVVIDATIDGVIASVVDLSHEGLCLALRNAEGLTLPAFFTLRVPSHDVACRVRRVWTGHLGADKGTLLCGAVLPDFEGTPSSTWRSFVDALPTGPVAKSAG